MYDTGITKITASGCLSELNKMEVVKKIITMMRSKSQYWLLSCSCQ